MNLLLTPTDRSLTVGSVILRTNVRNVFYMVYLVWFMSPISFLDGEIIQVLHTQCDIYVTLKISDNGVAIWKKNVKNVIYMVYLVCIMPPIIFL